jgi:hypothetical protein
VRRGDGSTIAAYDTHEVNGRYQPGKPVLEAPRAFAMSPFQGESNVVYVLLTSNCGSTHDE